MMVEKEASSLRSGIYTSIGAKGSRARFIPSYVVDLGAPIVNKGLAIRPQLSPRHAAIHSRAFEVCGQCKATVQK